MQKMIKFDESFKVNSDHLNFFIEHDHIYYVEFLDSDGVIVWWLEDDKWECNREYTRFDYLNNIEKGIWLKEEHCDSENLE